MVDIVGRMLMVIVLAATAFEMAVSNFRNGKD